MSESIALDMDMDAMLDDVLDELDDDDENDDANGNASDADSDGVRQDAARQRNEGPALSDPEKPVATNAKAKHNRRVPFGPDRPPPATAATSSSNNKPNSNPSDQEQILTDSFERMFKQLATRDVKQIQSELLEATSAASTTNDATSTSSSATTNATDSTPSQKTKSKKNNDSATKRKTPKSGKNSKPASGPTTSDEEKLLQGLFQGLMTATTNGDGGTEADDSDNDAGIPNLDDLFAGLGGAATGGSDNDGDGDFNTDDFMDGMMEQLLSKELMYEPMQQVTAKFPSWLESNKDKITPEEWDQRNCQYECFQRLVQAYENEDDKGAGSASTKSSQTQRLLELMQQVQEYGQPPPEIINEIAPGLELDEEGLPKINMPGGMMPPFMGGGNPGEEECLIM
uniref:Peroxin-19 n=1 Tax=Pseudo-nitzschia australis TaxID=44445 RepID=A0A7S4AM16_9STRA|mmetsp:Transcript_7585/g.14996  ORF Transcript_7585/g.14996 Transcript_7585/m.14996 type:complete len:399 (+) Transcript_7585:148-1344(+)